MVVMLFLAVASGCGSEGSTKTGGTPVFDDDTPNNWNNLDRDALGEADEVSSCVPACLGKVCGDNGCGGTCGKCSDPTPVCGADGQCKAGDQPCEPSCTGKECGDDGCNGSCGNCPVVAPICTDAGLCAKDCSPVCTGKQCGDDGCGGKCGTCPGDRPICGDGLCSADCTNRECGDDGCGGLCGNCPPVLPLCAEGQCVAECASDCQGKQCGDDGCGGKCGTCPLDRPFCENFLCKGNCVASCGNRECGDDGCGGSCGKCPAAAPICSDAGVCQLNCVPDCAGRVCGSNGCGGSCGTCPAAKPTCSQGTCVAQGGACANCAPWQTCVGNKCTDPMYLGACLAGGYAISGNCQNLTFEGCCAGPVNYYCDSQALHPGVVDPVCPNGLAQCLCVLDCAEDGANQYPALDSTCTWGDASKPFYLCDSEFPQQSEPGGNAKCPWFVCTPNCFGKECGENGCGGSCGNCGLGMICGYGGECIDTIGLDTATCFGYCGGSSLDGSCYCDDACLSTGDCCADFCDYCPDLCILW
jgi:hypothetical protein